MFWLDRIFNEAQDALKDKIAQGETLLIRDEKTASGRVHVGSLRALALHASLAERFSEAEIPHTFKYEINDYDVMDGLPVYLDKAVYEQHMGKILYYVPSPDGSDKNFADYFGDEYRGVIEEIGYHPEFYKSSDLYLTGKMDEEITLTLNHADVIRKIYKKVSGSVRPDNWHPLFVVCEKCGKVGTTRVNGFDGKEVQYTCETNAVQWAVGCGYTGSLSPYKGKGKLPWKVEWAAKWLALGVDVEGAGKDHYSKGGARDVAEHISREVFNYEPPFGVANEFFLVGGKKMSSSKGAGSSAREIANLVPPHILRLALLQKDINKQTNFDPSGDTIPLLFDQYETLAENYWQGHEDDASRLFLFIHSKEDAHLFVPRFLPKFSTVAFLVQMPHLNLEEEIERLKGAVLTDDDKKELALREKYAKQWLEGADEKYIFELQTTTPEATKSFSSQQKEVLKKVLEYIEENENLDGQDLHTALHEIRKESGIEAKDFFGALYMSFLNKTSGPKVGWFLSVLDRNYLLNRLREVSQ